MSRGNSVREYNRKSEALMVQAALRTPPHFRTAEQNLLDAAVLAERKLDKTGDWETAAHIRNAIVEYRNAKGAR